MKNRHAMPGQGTKETRVKLREKDKGKPDVIQANKQNKNRHAMPGQGTKGTRVKLREKDKGNRMSSGLMNKIKKHKQLWQE